MQDHDLPVQPVSLPPAKALAPESFPLVRVSAAAALLFSLVAGGVLLDHSLRPNPAAHCALPAGLRLEALTPREQALVVRRAMLCSDVEHGRIDGDHYLAALAALDAAALPPAPPPAMIWASSVEEMSSQYSADNWSAARVLGPPDVTRPGQDDVNAWASLGADDRVEFLSVMLARPARLSAVEIFETFNPGAVREVTLVSESGETTVVRRDQVQGSSSARHVNRFELGACTQEPIIAIRVTVDSPAVAGWNEIDAIGGQPCP